MSRLDVRAIDAGELAERRFPEVRHGFRLHVAEEAMDRITRRAGEQPDKEVGGVLVGELLRDAAGPYLSVETTIDALHAEEKGTELTFTHATWDHIHAEMDAEHQGRRIVGWYHTHPGFGIFLSDRDRFIHQSFFNLPHQIALVYDPRRREHGVFTWRDGEPVRCPRYWVGREEVLWEPAPGAETPPAAEARAAGGRRPQERPQERRTDDEEEPMRTRTTPEREAPGPEWPDWSMTGLAAVVALAVGLLAGVWWAGRGTEKLLADNQRRVDLATIAAIQDTVGRIDDDVLGHLRRLVDDDAARIELMHAADAVDRALRALEGGAGGRDQAVASLREARELLVGTSRRHSRAHQSLRALEQLARSNVAERRQAAGDLARQRAALAGLYLDLSDQAAAAGDLDRARRLLRTAATVDPENATYAERLRRLDEDGAAGEEGRGEEGGG